MMGYCTLGTSKPDLTLSPVTKPAEQLGMIPHRAPAVNARSGCRQVRVAAPAAQPELTGA